LYRAEPDLRFLSVLCVLGGEGVGEVIHRRDAERAEIAPRKAREFEI